MLGRLYAFTETRAIGNGGEAAKAHELIALSASQGLAAVVNKLPEGLHRTLRTRRTRPD